VQSGGSSDSNTTTAHVGEEFEIVQSASTAMESQQKVKPAGLVFVAVRDLNVSVQERACQFLELLQSDDGHCGSVAGVFS
jgi:hypothetical protein